MWYAYSKLTDEQLAKLKAFEERTGKKVIAFSEVDVDTDELTPEELQELKEMEKELEVVLVAYR